MLGSNDRLIAQSESFGYSFEEIKKAIDNDETCGIYTNPSNTAAIVNVGCGIEGTVNSGVYVNFKEKKSHLVVSNWRSFAAGWLNDKVAVIDSSCGIGCANEVIFIAPDILLSCSEYDLIDPPLFPDEPYPRSNRPLLIDPEKEIYVCYDSAQNIQVFPFPKHATILPPKGHTAIHAELDGNKLNITYGKDKDDALYMDSYLLK